jgi:TrmH family RNA methyltransferase
VVLVRPRHSGNVGAAARALRNMGLDRLVLVAPARRFDPDRAATLAVHARDVIDACRIVDTLEEAVFDCGLVVGTTSRPSALRAGATSPRSAAPEILATAARSEVALVFGPEDHGLSNEELALCQRVLTIPSSATYPSLNLAQSVLLCAYELLLADSAEAGDGQPAAEARASCGRLEFLYRRLEEVLLRVGFLHAGNAVHMMRSLRRIFGRAALREHDVQILLGMLRQVQWAADRAAVQPESGRAGTAGIVAAGDPGETREREEAEWVTS